MTETPSRDVTPKASRAQPPQPHDRKGRGRLVDPAVKNLWDTYKQTGDPKLRDLLLEHYTPMVQAIASRLYRTVPATIDFRDLVAHGLTGLFEAIERFDVKRELRFETYAVARIRGAMVDCLRMHDWLPRTARAKLREIERVYSELEAELGRRPTEDEVADQVGIPVKRLRDLMAHTSAFQMLSLSRVVEEWTDGKHVSVADRLPDRDVEQPGDALIAQEERRALRAAVATLPERYRALICLYYYEGLSMEQIGQILRVTESRASQLHAKALRMLHRVLVDGQPPTAGRTPQRRASTRRR